MQYDLIQELQKQVRKNPPSIVFPEAHEDKILQAVRKARDMFIAYPILLGKKEVVAAQGDNLGISLEGIDIVDPEDEAKIENYAAAFVKEDPAFSEKAVKRKLRTPLNYAAMMVRMCDADAMMAGLTHTTGEVLLAAQIFIGMQEGINTVSSLGILNVPGFQGPEGNLLVISDCAVCPNPNAEELADIAIASADTVSRLLGWEPRVAMLSFSTKGSGEHEIVEKVVKAVNIAKEHRPDLKIDGEFQLDAAIIPEVAAKKVREPSEVAGKANILIFPDLNAGNIGVKLVQRLANGSVYGPVLQGFAKPVSDLSRGAPLDEILGGITILAARAMKK
jgi:phosphate acetyltransferase